MTKSQLNLLIKECISEVLLQENISDPTKEEMIDFLKTKGYQNADGFDDSVEIAMYWFANDYHGGQWSNLYSVLSTSPYNPGPLMRGIESEGDGIEKMLYDELVGKFAPTESKMPDEVKGMMDKIKGLVGGNINELFKVEENDGVWQFSKINQQPPKWDLLFDSSSKRWAIYHHNTEHIQQILNINQLNNVVEKWVA